MLASVVGSVTSTFVSVYGGPLVPTVANAIARFREMAEEAGRTEPLDVCFTPFSHPGHKDIVDPAAFIGSIAGTVGSDRIDLVDLNRAGGLIRYRVARDGWAVFEAQPGFADRFQLCLHRSTILGFARRDIHTCSSFHETPCDHESDTAGTSRDERDFAVDAEHI